MGGYQIMIDKKEQSAKQKTLGDNKESTTTCGQSLRRSISKQKTFGDKKINQQPADYLLEYIYVQYLVFKYVASKHAK